MTPQDDQDQADQRKHLIEEVKDIDSLKAHVADEIIERQRFEEETHTAIHRLATSYESLLRKVTLTERLQAIAIIAALGSPLLNLLALWILLRGH